MKDIKVGYFVRTIYGEIFKVFSLTKQDKDYILVDREVDRNQDRDCNDNCLEKKEIAKYSSNIIDLIEVGDRLKILADNQPLTFEVDEIDYKYKLKDIAENIEIKSIITKEQMKNMEYEV